MIFTINNILKDLGLKAIQFLPNYTLKAVGQ